MQFDIRRFDIYRKIPKDLTQPTSTGGTISICCIFFIILLLASEFYSFITPEVTSQLYVQNGIGNSTDGKISVKLDISVFGTKCEYLGLDIQDDLGRHEVGHVEDTSRTEINNGEGCRMKVLFKVNRVPGNFHVSTHAAQAQPQQSDMGHHIHSLTFGDHFEYFRSIPDSSFNSLNGVSAKPEDSTMSHDYIMKIVPTIYQALDGTLMYPFQFTFAHREYSPFRNQGYNIPATIWFRYELNPITVKYTEYRQPIYHFLTTVCAIVGGTFTVAGIVDSLLFTATETFKKFQQGKLG